MNCIISPAAGYMFHTTVIIKMSASVWPSKLNENAPKNYMRHYFVKVMDLSGLQCSIFRHCEATLYNLPMRIFDRR